MINKIYLLLLFLSLYLWTMAQQVQKGPYTVFALADSVYRIEDSNDSNPAGRQLDTNGKVIKTNNCSDMYLIVGKKKALLIDLSNAINWDSTSTQSLRSIVYKYAGNRRLFITITHKHGDHFGMLPAFHDDVNARFWISKAEFKGMDLFPKERTTCFAVNESFDLGGGFIINSMEVPGHTEHSTIFFLKDKNLVFTGDAIGSGDGVWLFNYESFISYTKSIDNLINYIKNPANHIDSKKLVVYGGHHWQKGRPEELNGQYIFDMQTLIERIGLGTAESKEMSTSHPFLNTNFKFGTAYISWNKEAAVKYAESVKGK
jgi:glyoxylase-like metal-dependent hydrolase (beta-lactamase superfamily II)